MQHLNVDLPPLQGVPEEDAGMPQPCSVPSNVFAVACGVSSPMKSPSKHFHIDGSAAPDLEVILTVRQPLGSRRTGPQSQRFSSFRRGSSFKQDTTLKRDKTHNFSKLKSFNDSDMSFAGRISPDGSSDDVPSTAPGLWRRVASFFTRPSKRARQSSREAQYSPHSEDYDNIGMQLSKFLVHSDLLCKHSSYFARALRGIDTSDEGAPAVLIVEVNAKDVLLMREMMAFIYSRELPQDLDAACLIKLALLSDQYEMESCLECCIKRLAQQLQKNPEVGPLVQALHLPNQVRSATKLTSVTNVAVASIKAYLMDLERAWEKEELRDAFVALPFEVVKLLLESASLEVKSENTALMAVCSWLQHNYDQQDPEASQQAAAQLLRSVRFQDLTHSFLSQVATLLPWVTTNKHGYRCLVEALQYTSASSVMKRALVESGTCPTTQLLPRKASKRKHLKFTTCLNVADLQQAAAIADSQGRTQLITSSRHFFDGCCLRFQLEVAPADRINPGRGRIYGGLHWTLGLHPHGLAGMIEGLEDVQIRLVFEVHVGPSNGNQLVYSNIGKKLAAYNRCTGWPELLQSADPADWSKYADKDGKIVVKVVAFECE